jgi:hypothetical protein
MGAHQAFAATGRPGKGLAGAGGHSGCANRDLAIRRVTGARGEIHPGRCRCPERIARCRQRHATRRHKGHQRRVYLRTVAVDSNSEGKGVLAITLDNGITVETGNNSLSDMGDRTLIDPGTKLFADASTMKIGQRVAFSGDFASETDGACIRELASTLRAKVEQPEFVFRFSAVSSTWPVAKLTAAQLLGETDYAKPVTNEGDAAIGTRTAAAESSQIATAPTRALKQARTDTVIDCARAATSVEQMICADPELARADVNLSEYYK